MGEKREQRELARVNQFQRDVGAGFPIVGEIGEDGLVVVARNVDEAERPCGIRGNRLELGEGNPIAQHAEKRLTERADAPTAAGLAVQGEQQRHEGVKILGTYVFRVGGQCGPTPELQPGAANPQRQVGEPAALLKRGREIGSGSRDKDLDSILLTF